MRKEMFSVPLTIIIEIIITGQGCYSADTNASRIEDLDGAIFPYLKKIIIKKTKHLDCKSFSERMQDACYSGYHVCFVN